MSSLVQRNKVVARKKGLVAGAAAGGAVAAGIILGPIAGVIGAGAAGYLAWNWFSFRVKNGLRF